MLTIKLGLALAIVVWVGAFIVERPAAAVKTKAPLIWAISELAIASNIVVLVTAPHTSFGKWLTVAGAALYWMSIILYVWARIHLGQFWGEMILLRQGHLIVKEGPYRFLRHPICTAIVGALTGAALLNGSLWGLAATAFIAAPPLLLRAREEEKLLSSLPGGKDYYSK